jgi:hypothetical protein
MDSSRPRTVGIVEMNPLTKGIAIQPPPHDAAQERIVPAKLVTSWPVGTFVESLVAAADGRLIVSVHSEQELVWVDPASGKKDSLARLPHSPTGLSILGEHLFVSVGEPGQRGWTILAVQRDGAWRKVVDLPEALFLNGSTPFRGSSILVVDSILGRAIEIDTRTGAVHTWFHHPLLAKITDEPMIPGVNGVKVFQGHVYFTSTDRAIVLRVPVTASGEPGEPEVLAERFVGDDFAIDVDGNLYVTTHVHNQLQRLSPDGERTVLAGTSAWMNGATAAVFGRRADDRRALYVTTTGGIVAPIDGEVREARLVRLDVDAEGASVSGL